MSTNERQLKMLRKLVQADSPARLAALVKRMDSPDLAQLLLTTRPGEVRRLVDVLLRSHRAGDFLYSLPETTLREVWACIPGDLRPRLLERLGPDYAVTILRRLGPQHCDALLEKMPAERSDLLARLLRYPEDSAGGLMTTEILTVGGETTTGDTVELLRAAGEHATAVDNLCVVDRNGRLEGVVTLRQLLLADPERPLAELMAPDPIVVQAVAPTEEVAALVRRYDLLSLPVVDEVGRLEGLITVDDVVDLLHLEAGQALYDVAGLAEEDRVATPIGRSVRRRLGWTAINLCTAFLASTVVGLFAASIEQLVALASFMPVVAGLGGNSGTQSLTVVVRAIATGEMAFTSAWRVLVKQLLVGLAVGAAAGLGAVAMLLGWAHVTHAQGVHLWLAGVLFLAMLVNMAVGALMGAAVPLALRALRLDPALGSSIVVTAVTDGFGFFSFLGMATIAMRFFS
ncbi:MAG: magnesium transporter [Pseudomonadota bacterium]